MLSLPDCVCYLHVRHCYSSDPGPHSAAAEPSLSSGDDSQTLARLSPPVSIMFIMPCLTQAEHKCNCKILTVCPSRDGWAFRVGSWNVDSLTGRLGELVEALAERRMDVLCVQETRWRSDCRLFGAIGKKYKLFLMGNEAKTDGVGIFVAEKWADSVVRVERHSERIMVLKMVLGDGLLNVFSVYAPHSGRPDEEKECFWNEVFHLVSCIPQNEMVVFVGI